MVTIGSLWLPILLAAVLVFIASALIWMVLPHHRSDFGGFPDEASVLDALKKQKLAPGQYDFPHIESQNELKKPEVQQRFAEGPVGFFTVKRPGVPPMGKALTLSFIYYIVIGGAVAYLASRTLEPGAEYLAVFRVTGTVAWYAYGLGIVPDAIWFGRPWSGVWKHLLDAFVYACLTAGAFAWLWPA
jgi:hypothetical protein